MSDLKQSQLRDLASALSHDDDDDGNVDKDELTRALSNLGDDLSVDIVRGDKAAGSANKVIGAASAYKSGTLHIDGVSETHAGGELAPETMCTPPSTKRTNATYRSTSFQRKKDAEARVKEIMNMFDTDNDGVLDHNEQMAMYRAIVQKLEGERRKEAAARSYENTAAIRDQIAIIRDKIFNLDCDFERRRQANQKTLFERAMTARSAAVRKKLDADTAKTESRISSKIELSQQRAQLETQMLAKDLAKWPMPKPRYSKGLIELRHAEMALAQDQRYEEAQNVRVNTKIREAQEYSQLLEAFEHKKEVRRDILDRKNRFFSSRLDESVKDMRWRGRRRNQDFLKQEKQARDNHAAAMDHMLAMEMHKVRGTTHNVALPANRKPRPDTNASCRGSRLNDRYIGKRHLAIPSLSSNHDFKGPETFRLEEYKRKRFVPSREMQPN